MELKEGSKDGHNMKITQREVKFWIVYDMLTGEIIDMYRSKKKAWSRVLELDDSRGFGKRRFNIKEI